MTEMDVYIANIGGIESLEMSFQPGVTVISAPNASNKTSLLKAIAFGLGVDDVPVRSGTENAEVALALDGTEVTRRAQRCGVGIQTEGEAYFTDPTKKAQFESVAALLEFNSIRAAVRQGEDIETPLKRPVDFESLKQRRSRLLDTKREKSRELEQLADVEQRLEKRKAELDERRKRKEQLETKLDDLESRHEQEPEVDDETQSLRRKRTELLNDKERTLERMETTENALDRLQNRRDELTEQITTLENELEDAELTQLKEKRERIQDELDELEERIEVLQSPLTANREMLNSEYTGILGADHSLTADRVRCWTCGNEVPLSDIEETIDELRETIEAEKTQMRQQKPDVDELTAKVNEIQEAKSELESVRGDRREVEDKIENREATLETLSEQLEETGDELETVTAELEAVVDDDSAGTQRSEIEETRVEIGTLEREIRRLENECESLERDRERRATLESELEAIDAEIEEITTKIENIEGDIVDQFNDSMDEILETLAFEDIERIWLTGDFEVIVAREIDGSVQRDSVRNLAESERELVGIVLGFAGFKAYDLAEEIPVMVLDSLGALDNERLHALLTYFEDIPTYLIAAVQPDRMGYFDETGTTVVSFDDDQSPEIVSHD